MTCNKLVWDNGAIGAQDRGRSASRPIKFILQGTKTRRAIKNYFRRAPHVDDPLSPVAAMCAYVDNAPAAVRRKMLHDPENTPLFLATNEDGDMFILTSRLFVAWTDKYMRASNTREPDKVLNAKTMRAGAVTSAYDAGVKGADLNNMFGFGENSSCAEFYYSPSEQREARILAMMVQAQSAAHHAPTQHTAATRATQPPNATPTPARATPTRQPNPITKKTSTVGAPKRAASARWYYEVVDGNKIEERPPNGVDAGRGKRKRTPSRRNAGWGGS